MDNLSHLKNMEEFAAFAPEPMPRPRFFILGGDTQRARQQEEALTLAGFQVELLEEFDEVLRAHIQQTPAVLYWDSDFSEQHGMSAKEIDGAIEQAHARNIRVLVPQQDPQSPGHIIGADGYLNKTISVHDLAARAHELLESRNEKAEKESPACAAPAAPPSERKLGPDTPQGLPEPDTDQKEGALMKTFGKAFSWLVCSKTATSQIVFVLSVIALTNLAIKFLPARYSTAVTDYVKIHRFF